MKKKFQYKFVEYIPEELDEEIIYISMEYSTAIHLCACGCGKEVVTPLSPTDWELTFNGVSISLSPSIGNWSFNCQSHYWLKNSTISWAGSWTNSRIEEGRKYDEEIKAEYFDKEDNENLIIPLSENSNKKKKWWEYFKFW